MHDQHSRSQEDGSTSLKGDLHSDKPPTASANDGETVFSSADSSTVQKGREHARRQTCLTPYNTDGSVNGYTDSDAEWEVQVITDSKINPCRGFLYRVVWVGNWDDSWEPLMMLSCSDLVDDFHRYNPKKPSLTMGDPLEEE